MVTEMIILKCLKSCFMCCSNVSAGPISCTSWAQFSAYAPLAMAKFST